MLNCKFATVLLIVLCMTYLDLLTLSDSSCMPSQLLILPSSVLISWSTHWVGLVNLIVLSDIERVGSSASVVLLKILQALGKSLIYIIKSSGPSMDPCGTPVVKFELLTTTNLEPCVLCHNNVVC